jgi:UDPglucose 6-dehydrogenase
MKSIAYPRIGNYYNNPSFGYGGYCLPKDTKQLLSHYKKTPQNLISAIVDSNETRAEFIANTIIEKGLSKIGIYKLSMKTGSDNHRMSSILSVCEKLKKSNIDITIYDESLSEHNLLNIPIEKDFQHFANQCDLILANRIDNKLEYIRQKVLTRDIFARD